MYLEIADEHSAVFTFLKIQEWRLAVAAASACV